jgi:TetR/AcrR family transcriptional regulator
VHDLQPRSSDRILQKALELFSTKGYEATSVREICEASGLTKPTLYHFYGSKEGLYHALIDGALDAFRTSVAEILAQPGPTPERLRRVARSYFEYAESHQQLMRFIFSLVHNPSSSAPHTDFPRFYQELLDMVGGAIDDGVARGELRPGRTDVRLLTLMGSLAEALCGSLIVGEPKLTPELADALVESLLEGWSAPPSAP